ncbi:hypothetical protein MtrunA17_Chr7g0260221 [Medicago truncatula]|uniref:Inhibitor of apoptosis-promoting Bax1 protein n=1 Tax=Medicago truncatula TaxID=3880 RepID=A0A072UDB2_MEDTR|nr:inhibitor of apoptosis-promoting Bax1 protein [Medicago truncatula]RHN48111.1 hypothetical protein MtrunA17_Chr7g0260221 [Medicago truncatula]
MFGKGDIESGGSTLYPTLLESPELRWPFILKVYSILTFQLLLTIAVASVVVFVHPVANFFVNSKLGYALYIVLLFVPFITSCPLYAYHHKHPLNYFLLLIFTVALASSIGLTWAFFSGKAILVSVISTIAVVFSLTLYTYWAAKRGHDFGSLDRFLLGALLVLILFALILVLFPLDKLSHLIYGCLGAIIFYGYIFIDTDNLNKRFSNDEYILASISLYLNVIPFYFCILLIFTYICSSTNE